MTQLKCPKCGSTSIGSTLIGAMVVGRAMPDDANTAFCNCGYRAKASEFGGIFEPMQGTENWTDEQIEQWRKDMREGKIQFKEVIGETIVNSRGIIQVQRLS
jgi:hypothetical protein